MNACKYYSTSIKKLKRFVAGLIVLHAPIEDWDNHFRELLPFHPFR